MTHYPNRESLEAPVFRYDGFTLPEVGDLFLENHNADCVVRVAGVTSDTVGVETVTNNELVEYGMTTWAYYRGRGLLQTEEEFRTEADELGYTPNSKLIRQFEENR